MNEDQLKDHVDETELSEVSKPSERRSLLRDERGGMYAEAVIILPVFILVWSLIAFVNQGYRRTLAAGTQTRGAGWAHVINQCEDDAEPAAPVEMEDASGMYSGLLGTLAAVVSGGITVARWQPLILVRAETIAFQFDAHRYVQVEELARPRPLGGSAVLGHHIDLVCDEQHEQVHLTAWITASWALMR